MSAQPDLFGSEPGPQTARAAYGDFLDTDVISWAPCGCWMAVMIESADFTENAKRLAEFARDNERSGGGRIERIPHSRFSEIVAAEKAAGKKVGCDHDPKWGGLVATHRMCPRCHKDVKIRKDGTLSAHKYGWSTCSQEPWPDRRDRSQTSATVDVVPAERAAAPSAPSPSAPSDLAASAPDRAVDVASTTNQPRSDGAG